ncbi:helix-turn-helix domain-containing protein [Desulfobulbus elongatus]|uniref:helix-turn-helix domain-containing protein n=1 Tax=Desulfobulbus elongatus TaxID=53332 RepID=UPI00146FA7FE|nr:helix-turn-helix transcriptional regulator [Desulfobulbus elongatus]
MAKGKGGGETPQRVVDLVTEAVQEKGSQSIVARESGLTLSTVQRCLKGIGEPTRATYEKLAIYFNVSVSWLRGDDPEDYLMAQKNIDKEFLEEVIKFADGYLLQRTNNYLSFERRANLYAQLYYELKSRGGKRAEYILLQNEGEQLLKKILHGNV